MGSGVEVGGGGDCTESISRFHVFHNTRLHFEFLPPLFFANFSSSVFLLSLSHFIFAICLPVSSTLLYGPTKIYK